MISSNALDSSALCLAASIKTRIDINFFKLNHWSTKTSLNQIDVTKDIKYEKKTNLVLKQNPWLNTTFSGHER